MPFGRGLPSREAQVLKDLILSVCLSRFYSRFPLWHMDRLQTQMPFGLFPECPKGGPATLKDSGLWARFRGPTFFVTFSIFEQKISACSGGPQKSFEMKLFLANLAGFSIRKRSSRGRHAPRVQSSTDIYCVLRQSTKSKVPNSKSIDFPS